MIFNLNSVNEKKIISKLIIWMMEKSIWMIANGLTMYRCLVPQPDQAFRFGFVFPVRISRKHHEFDIWIHIFPGMCPNLIYFDFFSCLNGKSQSNVVLMMMLCTQITKIELSQFIEMSNWVRYLTVDAIQWKWTKCKVKWIQYLWNDIEKIIANFCWHTIVSLTVDVKKRTKGLNYFFFETLYIGPY